MRLAVVFGISIGLFVGCGKVKSETESKRQSQSLPTTQSSDDMTKDVLVSGEGATFDLTLPDEMIAEAETADRPAVEPESLSIQRFRLSCGDRPTPIPAPQPEPLPEEPATAGGDQDSDDASAPIFAPYAQIHLGLTTFGANGEVGRENHTLPYVCGIGQPATVEIFHLQVGQSYRLDAKVADFRGQTRYVGTTGKFRASSTARPRLVLKRVAPVNVDVDVDVVFEEEPVSEYCEPMVCAQYAIEGYAYCKAIWEPSSPLASALPLKVEGGNAGCARVNLFAKACELSKRDPAGKLTGIVCDEVFYDQAIGDEDRDEVSPDVGSTPDSSEG